MCALTVCALVPVGERENRNPLWPFSAMDFLSSFVLEGFLLLPQLFN